MVTMVVTTVIILLQIKSIWKKPVQKSSTGVKKRKQTIKEIAI